MEPIVSIINRRRSVRTYADQELDDSVLESIRAQLSLEQDTPFGNRAEFHLLRSGKDTAGKRIQVGTYGFISGAKWFIAGMSRPEKGYLFDYGFQLESIILELTRLDLGTCWLGGTFNRSAIARLMALPKGFEIPAVTPVGTVAADMGAREKLIRKIATADRRKPAVELFCPETLKTRDENILSALEMVRLAPSAENAQPWRVHRSGNTYHFYIKRSKGVFGNSLMYRLQEIDLGIAMAHFSLTLNEAERKGSWTVIQAREWEQPEDLEYVSTWVPA